MATVLSAQTTDARVNTVTPALFAAFPDASALAAARPDELEALLRPLGMQRTRAGRLIGLGNGLAGRFGGVVPPTREALMSLPGVGRKTANVVLGDAFGVPAITVDTHVGRLSRRLGWTTAATASSSTGGRCAARVRRAAASACWPTPDCARGWASEAQGGGPERRSGSRPSHRLVGSISARKGRRASRN